MSYKFKRMYEHFCGHCASFPICSKTQVKNAQKDTNYCLWEKDFYYEKEKDDKS